MSGTLAFLGFGGSFTTVAELSLLSAVLAFSGYVVIAGGTFSFAFVAFIGIGAYTGAIMTVDHGMGLAAALVVAPIISMIVAAVLAKPLERLSGVYLALVSVAVISVLRVLLLNLTSITGGALGISGIPSTVDLPELLVAVVLLSIVFWQVQRSMVGRSMRLLRADPIVAESMGVNVPRLRFWLFIASAAIGAIGGVLRASYFGFVLPGDYGFPLLIRILSMVILGGVAHWSAPIIGAMMWTFLPEWFRPLGDWREVATGLVLLAIILLLPQGITGGIAEWRRAIQSRLRRERVGASGRPPDAGAAEEPRPPDAADPSTNGHSTPAVIDAELSG